MALKTKNSSVDGSTITARGENRPVATLERLVGLIIMLLAAIILLAEYSQADDRKTRVISFLSSGIRTASTSQTSAFDVSSYTEGQVFVDVTATTGAPVTLDVTVQTSPDNTTWYTHTTITQITTTGQYRQAITNFGKYVRLNDVVGGTPSITYSATGVFKN